ncbi:MFS transporter [Amycolatopsis taiwanensis]|uniref:MFS transporter n=1 Tax=Amycolatopsis taiwanensis TaxID=342230 RepID=A0A9W6VKV1_9PSEU|nr:MFS transporter [Amycolatopsis taiwanensis]GLY69861.1 MFS transporter [Amycolatopsis taiwanensis]
MVDELVEVEPDTRRVRRIGIMTGVVLLLAYTIDYVDRFAISMALPSIGAEFDLSKTQQGLLVTVFAVVYMLCQIPAGVLADRVGARVLLLATLLLWSAFTMFTALAGSFAILLILRATFGASQGFFPAASFKTVAERTTPKNRGTVMGIVMSASGIGSGITPLIVAPLLIAYGWRGSFVWLAAVGAVLGIVLWLLIPRKLPARMRESVKRPPKPSPEARRAVLSSPQVWLLAGLFCAKNFIVYGLITWVPSYLLESKGVSLAKIGVLAAIPPLVSFATTVLGGWLFDRYFNARPRWYLFATTLTTACLLVPMALATSAGQFILFEALAMAIDGLGSMCLFGLPMRVFPSALTGSGMGVINFGGQVAGASAPLLLGMLVDGFSYPAAFGLLVVASLIGAVLAVRIPQRAEDFSFTAKGV